MGLRSLLFPWYRWNDRWAHHVTLLGEGDGENPIRFTAPPGERHIITGIVGRVETHALGPGSSTIIRAFRGSLMFALNSIAHSQTAGNDELWAYQRRSWLIIRNAITNMHTNNLPDTFVLLPGDTLQVELTSGAANDHLHDWVMTSHRWED